MKPEDMSIKDKFALIVEIFSSDAYKFLQARMFYEDIEKMAEEGSEHAKQAIKDFNMFVKALQFSTGKE